MEGWGNAALEVPQLEGAVGHEEGEVEVMMGACPGRSGLLTVPQSRALLGPGLSAVRGLWLRGRIWLLAQTLSLSPWLGAFGWLVNFSEPPLPYL